MNSAVLLTLSVIACGCAVGTPELDEEGSEHGTPALEARRRVLVCEQGLGDRLMKADRGVFSLCESADAAGFELVWDGDYPAFAALNENGAYNRLFDALDTNGDGYVDADDAPADVYLAGFSWGGINVTDIAKRLGRDDRVDPDQRSVMGMVLFDPFQPFSWRANISANVVHAWEYRQTVTTAGDCSSAVSLGFGFNGKTPRARSAATFCTVYDLDEFMDDVGHCDVPSLATDAAFLNLTELEDYPAWKDYAEDCPLY